MKITKEFWYDSNACWGWVKSIEDLKEKLNLQLTENNGYDSIYDILINSRQHEDGSLNFGTRIEHTSNKTLYDFLSECGLDISKIT